MIDRCTFPGCGMGYWASFHRHVPDCDPDHDPSLYCHPFQSAREPRAEEARPAGGGAVSDEEMPGGRWTGVIDGDTGDFASDLVGADLRGADLSEANLSGANLSEADLFVADFFRATLSEANLRRADLSEADLLGADLRWADLRRADLQGADLRLANLCDADLSYANLFRANLRGADLRRANLGEWERGPDGVARHVPPEEDKPL